MRLRRTAVLAARLGATLPAWVAARGARAIAPPRRPAEVVRERLAGDQLDALWDRRAPVLLEGFLDGFAFRRLLHPAVMRHAWGSARTVTFRAPRHQRAFLQEQSRPVFIDYDELIDRIFVEPDPDHRHYSRMGGHPGALYELTGCARERRFAHVGIWIGEAENITPFHFDTFHSLLGQTHGDKLVVLIPPEDGHLLGYRALPVDRGLNRSAPTSLPDDVRGLEAVDPSYARTRRLEVVVSPGDLLYIPPGWWHWVVALEPNVSVLLRYHASRRDVLRTPETVHYVWRELLAELGAAPPPDQPDWDEREVWSGNEVRRLRAARAEVLAANAERAREAG